MNTVRTSHVISIRHAQAASKAHPDQGAIGEQMEQGGTSYVDFYGVRIGLETHPFFSPNGDRAMLLVAGIPCDCRNLRQARVCDGTLLIPLALTPLAALCSECYAIHLVEPAESAGRYYDLTDTTTQLNMGDRSFFIHSFGVRSLANGGEDSFNRSLAYIARLRTIIENNTRGRRVITPGGWKLADHAAFVAFHPGQLEDMDHSTHTMVEHLLLPYIPEIVATVGIEAARGYAELARALFPNSIAARQAHWDTMR